MKTFTLLFITFLRFSCSAGGIIFIEGEESVERVKNNVMEFWADQRDLIPVVSKQIPLSDEQVRSLENSKTWVAKDFRDYKETFIEELNSTIDYKRKNEEFLRRLMGDIEFKKFSNGIVLLKALIHMLPTGSGTLRILTYDGVRAEGGFNAISLENVSRIISSGKPLSDEEIEQIVTSKTLKNLHTLDLSKQEKITDETVQKLSLNDSFRRIINLDLSNTYITNRSIDHLLSGCVGSIRDLPQMSARFEVPSTTIYLTAQNTGIQSEFFIQDFERNFFGGGGTFTVFSEGVHIDYLNPLNGKKTSKPVDQAIKMIEVTLREA